MRKLLFSIVGLSASMNLFSQNVGIGTTTPVTTLHIKSTVTGNPLIIDGLGNNTYYSILENGVYRGYWGSFSGNPEDVDFGTGSGTTGKLHLTIQAVPKLTINNAGLVGIGTTNPLFLMHVNGGDLFVQSSSGNIKFGYQGSNQWQWATTNGGADLLMRSSPDDNTPTTRVYFTQAGRVGIGASSPSAPLHINTTSSEVIRMQGANPYMSFYDNTDGYSGYLWYNGADMVLAGTGGHAMRFVSNGGYKMTINTDGRVSIGSANTLATGYLLNVDGKIICTEARVQLSASWPDYVFNNNYKLIPIEDLEKNIRQNKHLPNIPSAADITADKGFEVGEMNRKLLEKVEELTLYIIELNKQNKAMNERIMKLEEK